MKRIYFILALSAIACGSPSASTTDPGDTDSVQDDSHPLVPEEYALLWNTEGSCSNEFGDGDQMYMIFDGEVDADGNFSGTEQVWWFFAGEDESKDCVDTFALSGTAVTGDPTALGCVSCEEFYTVRRTITENNCNSNQYARVYQEDDDGLLQNLMIDTLNEFNDSPNEDNRIGVFHEEWNIVQKKYTTKMYAAGPDSQITPSGSEHGPPAAYRWVGDRCHISWGR